jgi:hypothetical protein
MSIRPRHGAGTKVALLAGLVVCAIGLLPAPGAAAQFFSATGSITSGDPTQTDRLFRDSTSSTCAAPKASPGVIGDGLQRHYDLYKFRSLVLDTQCVTVTLDAMTCVDTNFIFSAAYQPAFSPTNIQHNYLADPGSSPNPGGSYSFNVAGGDRFAVDVNEVTANAGCAAYGIQLASDKPWANTPPKIIGTPTVGSKLIGKLGQWAGVFTFQRQWRSCDPLCTDIPGATGRKYTPKAGDVGKTLVLRVTATDGVNSSVADSSEVGPVT